MSRFLLKKSNQPRASNKAFGIPLEHLVERQGSAIPDLVYQSVKCIEKAIETPGLFTVAPKKVKVQLMRKQFEDSELDLSKSKDIHEVVDMLRAFFAELPDPLLTTQYYDSFIAAARLGPGEERTLALQSLLAQLPPANRVIFGFLMTFLRKILEHSRKNHVSPAIIGRFIGPAILPPRDGPQELGLVSSLCAVLVEEYTSIIKPPSKPVNSAAVAESPKSIEAEIATDKKTPTITAPPNAATRSTSTNTAPRTSTTGGAMPLRAAVTARRTGLTNRVGGKSPLSPESPASPRSPRASPPSQPASPRASLSPTGAKSAGLRTTTATTNMARRITIGSSAAPPKSTSAPKKVTKTEASQSQAAQSPTQHIEIQQPQVQVQAHTQNQPQPQATQPQPQVQTQPQETVIRPAILRMRANYDFSARDDTEISIVAGGVIDVVAKDESGWWWGRTSGSQKVGLFPSTYCETIEVLSQRKLKIKDKGLSSTILQLQKQCGFVKPAASQKQRTAVRKSQTIEDIQKKMLHMKGFPGALPIEAPGPATSPTGNPASNSTSPSSTDNTATKITSTKSAKPRRAQSIEALQAAMVNLRGFPATPEAVTDRQRKVLTGTAQVSSTPQVKLHTSSKIRELSARIAESKTIHSSPELLSKFTSDYPLSSTDDVLQKPPSSPVLTHPTLKRAKVLHRRPSLSIRRKQDVAQAARDISVPEPQDGGASFLKELTKQEEQVYGEDLFGRLRVDMEQQQNTIVKLQLEKTALEEKLTRTKREAMDNMKVVHNIKSELDSLKTIVEELRRERDFYKAEADSMQVARNESLELTRTTSKKLEQEKDSALAKFVAVDKQLADTRAEVNMLRTSNSETKASLDAALKELSTSKEREQVLGTQLEHSKKAIDKFASVEADSMIKDKKLADLQGVIAKLADEMEVMKSAYKEEQLLRKKYFNMMEDMKGKIRVYCRSRPIHAKESQAGHKLACSFTDPYTIDVATALQSKSFGFDRVFPPDSTQAEVFSDTSHLIQSSLDGYNVCIFAYGQTGSGKTYTLLGDEAADQPGICPRAMGLLFDTINKDAHRFKVSVRCYMLEVYNDNLVDLLWKHSSEKPPKLNIKKDSKGIVFVENVTIRKASTYEKLRGFLRTGLKHRHTGATKMNDQSSRSHLVFTIMIKSKNLQTKQKSIGKLSFVDLAGSERAAKSGASEERLKEAMSINKSLSALGNVINALSSGESFIPYRNNKLTQLMSDSIGGNAKTLMFVNISPNDFNADESIQSLSYGARAKLITNTATQMVESQEVQRLKRVIAQLKAGAHVELESTFGDPSNNLDEKMDDDGVLEKEDG